MTNPMTLTERVERALFDHEWIGIRFYSEAPEDDRIYWTSAAQAVLAAIEASGTHAVIDRDRAMHMLNIMPRTRVVEQLTDLIAARTKVTP